MLDRYITLLFCLFFFFDTLPYLKLISLAAHFSNKDGLFLLKYICASFMIKSASKTIEEGECE